MPHTPELDAALLAAAQVLPAHFANPDGLSAQPVDAIQATTMSLPGGAFAVEANLNGLEGVGSVVLIITGLVDHKNGEVFDRTEARTLWTAALTEGLEAMQGEAGEFKAGQGHMTDPFDVLDGADEASVVGIFEENTLAAMLLAVPSESTGEGAAAELAAAIAAAEAELEEAEAEGEGAEVGDGEGGSGADADADATEGVAADAEAAADGDAGTPGGAGAEAPQPTVAAGVAGVPGAAGMGGMPGMGGAPGAEYGGYGMGYPPPGYPPYGYPAQPVDPQEAAAAAARAAAQAQANMNLPGMTTPPLTPFMPGHPMDPRRIEMLREVIMGVSVELGRTRMTVQEILGLTPGSVVELDRAAGAPVDVLVNGTLIAHGEVVVVDEEFAVRISEVVGPEQGGEGRASA